jgi:hypothetical protein
LFHCPRNRAVLCYLRYTNTVYGDIYVVCRCCMEVSLADVSLYHCCQPSRYTVSLLYLHCYYERNMLYAVYLWWLVPYKAYKRYVQSCHKQGSTVSTFYMLYGGFAGSMFYCTTAASLAAAQ